MLIKQSLAYSNTKHEYRLGGTKALYMRATTQWKENIIDNTHIKSLKRSLVVPTLGTKVKHGIRHCKSTTRLWSQKPTKR